MFYCKGKNVLLTEEDLKRIPRGYTKLVSIMYKGRRFVYRTLKKKNGSCIFFKRGQCTAKYKPLLCRTHPIYFDINFQDRSIVWKSFSGKKRPKKKVKKALIDFIEKEKPETIFVYIVKSRKLKLKPLEEEALPKGIIKKIKEVKKFL